MNKYVFSLVLLTTAICALAFSIGPPGYVPPPQRPYPPLISLTNAYRIATDAIAPATNRFHCIWTNGNLSFGNEGDWLFVFATTNREIKAVYVLRNILREETDTNDVATIIFDDPQNE